MKKNMDERELMEMYKIEHYMFWFTFWALFASLIIQAAFCGFNINQIAGEFIVFILMSVISCILYLIKGIYDTWSQPGIKSYFVYSLMFSILTTVFVAGRNYYLGYIKEMNDMIITAAVTEVLMFIFLFIVLFAVGEIAKKRRKKLAEQYENND